MSNLEHRVINLERQSEASIRQVTILVWQHGGEPQPLDGEENKGAEHMREYHLEDKQRAICYLEVKDFQEGRFRCHICEYRESYEPTPPRRTPGKDPGRRTSLPPVRRR